MKITSYAVARPQYYDRNAVSTFFSGGGTYGTHVNTTRWTTTVAAGQKLLIEQGEVFCLTIAAAAVPRRIAAKATITDGTYLTSFASQDGRQSASTTTPDEKIVYPSITVYTGETVYGTTFNESLTGTVFMFVGMKGTTFQS